MIKHTTTFCLMLAMVITGTARLNGQDDAGRTITGTVRDARGDVLPDVNVSVPDEFTHRFTDAEGQFSIEVLPGKSLYFSKQGYEAVSREVEENTSTMEIVLELSEEAGMVEVAYGKRSKVGLTHSISTVHAENLEKTPVPNLSNAIPGRATGLTVIKNSGDEPGYDNSSIYVRGIGTFNSFREPLVMVDNVERDFRQMDPMEIESFSVLKDAAATVQYGIRGANGVINVRTKRGFTGRPEINFIAQTGFQTPFRLPEYLGSEEYVKFYLQALENDGLPVPEDPRFDPSMYDGTQDPYTFPDVDWYDEFLKSYAPQQQYKLSMRGGTPTIRYFMFMGATLQNGIYEYADVNPQYNTNPKFTRYNLRSNIDVDVTKSLLVSVDLATRVENRHVPNSSAGSIFSTLSQLPPNAMPVLNRDSSIAGTSIYRNNPLGMISRTGYRDNYRRILMANVEATQQLDFLLEGLSLNGMIGLDGTNYYSTGRSQSYAVYQEFITNDTTEYIQYGENSDISINTESFDGSFEYMLTTIGGFSYSGGDENAALAADLKYMQSKYFLNGNNIAYANQGIFGRTTYGIDKTYFFEFGFAYNGSENFMAGNRFGFFPAISGAWIMSNEPFMSDSKRFNFLKMRGSLGKTGNGRLGVERFPFEEKFYAGGGYIFGSGFGTSDGSYEGRLPNPDIGWEESYNINIGFDMEMKNRMEVAFDLFSHYRVNIITTGTNTIPSIIGQDLPYENNGTVLNSGFETMVKYGERKGNWFYSLQGNLSFAFNRILNMDEAGGLPDYQSREGKSASAIWGLEAVGFFRDEADIESSPLHTFESVQPGDVKYRDQNDDNLIDYQDQVVIGNSIPQLNLGILATAGYKNFDLNMVVTGTFGRTVVLTNNSIWIMQNNNKATALAYQAWQAGKENKAEYPRLTTISNNNNYNTSTLWAKRADYLKLVNFELGYTLPDRVMSRLGMSEIRFFLNTYNLASLDMIGQYNLDPEVPDAGVSGYPLMRVFNTGLSLKF